MVPEKSVLEVIWQKFVHWLPFTIVALIGVTATAVYQSIGVVALGFVWLILIIVGISFYAFRKQRECITLKDKAVATTNVSTSDSEAHTRIDELEGQIGALRRDADSAKAQNVQFAKEIDEWKSKARKMEDEGRVLRMTLAKQAEVATESPQKQEASKVIVETEIAIPPRDGYEVTSKQIKRGEIEVVAQSLSKTAFNFLLLDSASMEKYSKGYSTWESVLVKSNVSYFKEKVRLPRGDLWWFVVERAIRNDQTQVRILVTLTGQ